MATSTSWKNRQPFNDGVPLPYSAVFDDQQLTLLKVGLIPRVMENKWFIYYDEPHLFLHRSWTGLPVFRLTLKCGATGAEVVEALYSTQLANAPGLDVTYQARLLDFLISNLLLGQRKPFPVPSNVNQANRKLLQHHLSGTGFHNSAEPGPRKPSK